MSTPILILKAFFTFITFDVSMQFHFVMQVVQAFQNLSQYYLDMTFLEFPSFHEVKRWTTS